MKKNTFKQFNIKNFNSLQILFLFLILLVIGYLLSVEIYKNYTKITYQGHTKQVITSDITEVKDKNLSEEETDVSQDAKLRVVSHYFLTKDSGEMLSDRTPDTEKLVINIKPNITEERFKKIEIKPLSNQKFSVKLQDNNKIIIEFLDEFREDSKFSFISISENSELIFKLAYYSIIDRELIYPDGVPSYR